MSKQKADATRIAARRTQVARLLLDRLIQEEIATRLGVSQSTIHADIGVIRTDWTEEARTDLSELIAHECRILDADEAAWRTHLQKSLKDNLPLAIRIYDRIVGPTIERRARLRGILPPPKSSLIDANLLDQLLAELDSAATSAPSAADSAVPAPPHLPTSAEAPPP